LRGDAANEVTMNRIFMEQEMRRFLLEDLAHAEVTPSGKGVHAVVIAKGHGIMCGGQWLIRMLELLSDSPKDVSHVHCMTDGQRFQDGDTLVRCAVDQEVLRHGIRTGLNLLQHLSGIAVNTADAVARVADTGCILLDTRKSTPGFRAFEKYAVRVGGANNHRFNRLDGTIIKKEDIRIDGTITNAVLKAWQHRSHLTRIEVEVEDMDQLKEALALPQVDVIMLDNMTPEQVTAALALAEGRKPLEASGVAFDRLREYAVTGVPFISTSGLVRNARPVNMSMRILPYAQT
jgi:nicotinate-nucleotide pyrophosphorylase (carboxylating)